MRAISVILGFALIFNYLFNLQHVLLALKLLPVEFYQYPQSRFSKHELMVYKLILGWAIPIAISTIFVLKAKIHKRLTINYGYILFSIAVATFILRMIILYLTTFIQGGGATFVTAYLVGYLAFPLKFMLVFGAVKLLITLKPLEHAQMPNP